MARPLPSADLITGEAVEKAHYERSDISVVPAAGIVAEAMVMLTLARFVLEKVGGDTVADALANLATYRARIARPLDTPVVGRRTGDPTANDGPIEARHGLTGSDEAGSGGDD